MKLLTMLSLILLSGCYTNNKIDQSLLSECPASPPPTLTGNDRQDVKSISAAWMDQTSNLGKCNEKLNTIRDRLKGD